jgi:hypothetical protein
MSSNASRVSLAILTAAAVGCSPGGTETRVPESGPDIGAPYVPWRGKSHEERQAFMGAHVEPIMRKLFQGYSAKGYADFGCETCHGSNMDLIDFKMPNAIYPLPEKDTIAEASSYDEATTKFMVEKVVPTFAGLLSEHAVSPGQPGGVSCFTCHPHE